MKRYFGYKSSNKDGFTLAEILITLSIVGIVAAMTVPSLMMNYQKKVWETKLEKSFSVAVNACERMLVEENISSANETRLYRDPTSENVRRYFKVTRNGDAEDQRGLLIALPDNTDLYFNAVNSNGAIFRFLVDVNGNDRPNEAGKDQFVFNLDNNCTYTYTQNAEDDQDMARYFNEVMENNWRIPDEYAAVENAQNPPEPDPNNPNPDDLDNP